MNQKEYNHVDFMVFQFNKTGHHLCIDHDTLRCRLIILKYHWHELGRVILKELRPVIEWVAKYILGVKI